VSRRLRATFADVDALVDEILAGHRPERESQAPFAAAAECGPGNGDDVRLVQQTVGERRANPEITGDPVCKP